MVGLPGHDKAKNFIVDIVKKYDEKKTGELSVKVENAQVEVIQSFYQKDFDNQIEGKFPKNSADYIKWNKFTNHMIALAQNKKNVPVENIVWKKEGLNPKKVLVLTAHYDTISHDKTSLLVKENEIMPGANYNATGVVVALSILRTIAQFDINYSVHVVFLDWQGLGFFGSYLYAQELKALKESGKEILGVINLEMLGQDSTYFDKNKKNGNMAIYTRDLGLEKELAQKLITHGKQMTKNVDFELRANGFENSDNIRFWEFGIPAVTFSQNWEEDFNPKFYQTPQDTPEVINHKTLFEAYQYIGGAVIGTLLDITK